MTKPLRLQRTRIAGAKIPPDAIYVGRPTIFGNPWSLEEAVKSGLFEPGTERQVCFDNFKTWLTRTDYEEACKKFPLYEKLKDRRAEVLRRLPELRGKDLVCWCPITDGNGETVLCHADVLLELANATS